MVGMHLPTHLGVQLAAEHQRDLEAVSHRRRLLVLTRGARPHSPGAARLSAEGALPRPMAPADLEQSLGVAAEELTLARSLRAARGR